MSELMLMVQSLQHRWKLLNWH